MSEYRLKDIAQQLSQLEQQKQKLLTEREALLSGAKSWKATSQQETSFTTNQKVELFMSLFNLNSSVEL